MKVQHPIFWPCAIVLASANAALVTHGPRQVPSQSQISSAAAPSAAVPSTPLDLPTTSQTLSTASPTPATHPPTTTVPASTPSPATDNTTTAPQPPQASSANTSTTAESPTSAPNQPAVTQQTSAPSTNAPAPNTSAPLVTPSLSESVGQDGSTVTITRTPTASSTSSSSSTAQPSESDDGGGLSTGSIIGMSVAAGVAVIGIVGFFVWKFTRKRFSDFDDNEAIKWPELNTHSGSGPDSHALPARETGRSGFETASEADLSRVDSTTNYSTADFGAGGPDPYAVPPLPHLDPNQPYRDDPSGASGFYDPYRGPVPGTIEHGAGDWHPGEAYPMTQFNQSEGRASPAPDSMYGASSSGPQVAYSGRASPGPQVAYSGRASPGPQAAYGGRASPGPYAAFPTGRASPGPGAAYAR